MRSIKIVGILIPIVAITLAIFSHFLNDQNMLNRDNLNTINSQKAFTQEISKNIFYIYKNKNSTIDHLEEMIKKFLNNKNSKLQQSQKIVKLWNSFYLDVQKFRDHKKAHSAYSSIVQENLVKSIYHINLQLVVEFDKNISKVESDFLVKMSKYKYIEYVLYGLLVLLLVYLASKIHYIIAFIQKFLNTSSNILENSTIKGLEPIQIQNGDENLQQASDNFNSLVSKINSSIEDSTISLDHSHKSLEQVENDIENFMELLNTMDSENTDKNFSQKEDAVIESLEEIMIATEKLKNLKKDLNNLIS